MVTIVVLHTSTIAIDRRTKSANQKTPDEAFPFAGWTNKKEDALYMSTRAFPTTGWNEDTGTMSANFADIPAH